ncbi:MAG TPA: hypothetical protein VH950_06905 [Gaiellaceae bacterium]
MSGEEVNQMQWVLRKTLEPRLAALAMAVLALAVTPIAMADQLFPGSGDNTPAVHPPWCPPIC